MHKPAFHEIRGKFAETFRKIDTLKVGSMFTGWAILEMILGTLQSEWNATSSIPKDASMQAQGQLADIYILPRQKSGFKKEQHPFL